MDVWVWDWADVVFRRRARYGTPWWSLTIMRIQFGIGSRYPGGRGSHPGVLTAAAVSTCQLVAALTQSLNGKPARLDIRTVRGSH